MFFEATFHFFGGIFDELIFDNDSVLVSKVIGTERKLTNFTHAFVQHYDVLPVFCNRAAGKEKGHDRECCWLLSP